MRNFVSKAPDLTTLPKPPPFSSLIFFPLIPIYFQSIESVKDLKMEFEYQQLEAAVVKWPHPIILYIDSNQNDE